MQEKVIVAVDAMGGDNAPAEIVKGVVDAVSQSENVIVKLVGQENVVSEELKKYTYRENAIEIVNATEVIETGETERRVLYRTVERVTRRPANCSSFSHASRNRMEHAPSGYFQFTRFAFTSIQRSRSSQLGYYQRRHRNRNHDILPQT